MKEGHPFGMSIKKIHSGIDERGTCRECGMPVLVVRLEGGGYTVVHEDIGLSASKARVARGCISATPSLSKGEAALWCEVHTDVYTNTHNEPEKGWLHKMLMGRDLQEGGAISLFKIKSQRRII